MNVPKQTRILEINRFSFQINTNESLGFRFEMNLEAALDVPNIEKYISPQEVTFIIF